MMSCRQSTVCQTCDQVSRKLSLSPPVVSFAFFSSALPFFILFAVGKSGFFSLPDTQVLHLWEAFDKAVGMLTGGGLLGLVPCFL